MPTHTGSMPNTDSIRVPRWVSGEGRAIFCPKHCYGPMDCWYDCQECVDENTDAPKNPCHIPCNEKRKATDVERAEWRAFGRRLGLRTYKISTIYRKMDAAAKVLAAEDKVAAANALGGEDDVSEKDDVAPAAKKAKKAVEVPKPAEEEADVEGDGVPLQAEAGQE